LIAIESEQDNADILDGGAGNDRLYGGGGDDLLDGGADKDWLVGGSGADTLLGGAGDDALFADFETPPASASLSRQARSELSAASAGDILDGGAGNDVLHAGAGSRLIGGEGADTFILTASSAGSVIEDLSAQAGDRIDISQLMDSIFYGNDFETNPFATGNLRLVARDGGTAILFDADGSGSDYADIVEVGFIPGATASDLAGAFTCTAYPSIVIDPLRSTIIMGSSDWEPETLIGTDADDTILGGEGRDLVYGRGGRDDLMGGGGDDDLHGEGGDDLLQGGWGNDLLDGGTGDDVLIGAGGSDVIQGGEGQDTARFNGERQNYVVEELPDGTLRITDIRPGP